MQQHTTIYKKVTIHRNVQKNCQSIQGVKTYVDFNLIEEGSHSAEWREISCKAVAVVVVVVAVYK